MSFPKNYSGSIAAPDTEAPELLDPVTPWDDHGPQSQQETLRPFDELFLQPWKNQSYPVRD